MYISEETVCRLSPFYSISCDLSLNGNLRGGTRVAYSVNVSEFISLLLSLVRWLVICYLERQMETGESEYIDG